ncbi:AraC family transcriptional regulator [Paenibacillus frigoriresistens]|uniref:AraC family transcriptional regulator n=1 Tax=Paenibacillus alginolyticus TaxID=59839 RepID=UPI00156482C8|nr:AraC family transcriptional regulator [Paenibacillus frigoriresistens]NRF92890.1 AraC family transcriptional regulator [Paenibacillus frigoriresistens]
MGFLKRIQHYRVYRRLILSYLFLIMVTIGLLCTILYSMFSNRAVKEIDLSSREMLSQVSYTANVVFEQVQNITNQLMSDNQIITFMYANDDDKVANYNANLLLSKMQSVYPFLANISIYNFTNNAYVDVASLPPDPQMGERSQTGYLGFYPRKVLDGNGNPLQLLTFKIIPEPVFSGPTKSAIVLDLKETYIQNTMSSISSSSSNTSTFVMDSKGTVISHSDSEQFMKNFSESHYVQRILSDEGSQGSFVQSLDHHKFLITYVKSEKLDWVFVSVRPYDQLLSNIYELRNWTLLIALFLFLTGACISLIVTGTLYNPIKALVDKVTESGASEGKSLLRLDEYKLLSEAFSNSMQVTKSMEMTLSRSSDLLKNGYMYSMLKGHLQSSGYKGDIEQQLLARMQGPYFAVIQIQIDQYHSFKNTFSALDRELIRFAISNIAQEMLSKLYRTDQVILEENEITMIIQLEQSSPDMQLYYILNEIQGTVKDYYKTSVSVSMGDTVSAIGDIERSYRSTQRNMALKLFWGYGSLLDATKSIVPSEHIRYPAAMERKIIDAIKLCQPKTIQKEIAEWTSLLSRCGSPSLTLQYASFLHLAITREFESMVEWWDADPKELYLALNELPQAETLDEIQTMMKLFCLRIVDMIEENKTSLAALKNSKVIEEVKLYLQQHYHDPNLSLEIVADQVGLTSGYIGKMFKSMVGTSFNDHVTHIRMEQAKTLLAGTNETVAQIGEQVGIYNVSYFSTLFKKKYGVTPSRYREQHQQNT